jgi:hypothetical protein
LIFRISKIVQIFLKALEKCGFLLFSSGLSVIEKSIYCGDIAQNAKIATIYGIRPVDKPERLWYNTLIPLQPGNDIFTDI